MNFSRRRQALAEAYRAAPPGRLRDGTLAESWSGRSRARRAAVLIPAGPLGTNRFGIRLIAQAVIGYLGLVKGLADRVRLGQPATKARPPAEASPTVRTAAVHRSQVEIPGRKLRDFRLPHAETAALVISALSFAGLIYLARHGSFFYDEWDYVFGDASFTPRMLLQPHNEHPSLIPRAMYWTMFRFFGLRTYFPYLVWVVAFHVGTGLALFHLLKTRSGDLVALPSMLVFLFLGAGYEDIIQPFQMSFDASTMFGLAALQLLSSSLAGQSRHSVAAGLALLASLMSSGIGIPFAIACGTYLVLAKERRRLLAVAVPVTVFLAWFATLGHANLGTAPQ